MSAQVHLHREEQGQEAGLRRQAADLSGGFDIDISVCMSCQICVEVCPFEAIKMDNEFELSTDDRFGGLLLRSKDSSRSRTSIITRFIRPKPPKWMRGWLRKKPRRKPRPKPTRKQPRKSRRSRNNSCSRAGCEREAK